MSRLDSLLKSALARIESAGQRRTLRAAALAGGGRVIREGRELVDFSSNDYLGLARHPLLIERSREWTARLGTGSGASRLVTGTSDAHLALEARIAQFKGAQAALIFASGWQANAAVIPALLAAVPGAAIFTDRLIHASMHAGIAMAGVRQHRFRHNDLDHLETLLADKGRDAPARMILTESVFSMDGDRADMARLAAIAEAHDAVLFIDEAHATGVLGPGGAGLSAEIPGRVDLIMGTFSKALGGFGAYVAGSQALIDYLVNTASGFIFTTAPPPAVLGAIDAALDLVPGMDAERAHLAALGDRLRAGLSRLGLDHGASSTQIVPAVIGAEADAMALSARLETAGLLASAIRPPTVPPGTSRLRIALRASQSEADVDALLTAIEAHR
ncbi:aminotransferase class I/II-fold pyridoxal phosphate-dependent enzyme [Novosphingobium pentaromativorans]|uniref:8-amino-7-oxononanoate synthase n=1 Tax=Novosphingobium pentaromativorans US6-1 TaxID=1088721 RepID=G6ECZ5_9SPHN|nr:8-amino-7-oxononanoate synthase [Novosphingobium pentaromativorans]AIT79900.1 8-amino-7-oxononanoate synthase [Novosphingobium pentaromativorans US6-1]EHJ60833.1 8-amino-7-oxononanoate synthase [Novosphingobium pentaromativorans US6-1]